MTVHFIVYFVCLSYLLLKAALVSVLLYLLYILFITYLFFVWSILIRPNCPIDSLCSEDPLSHLHWRPTHQEHTTTAATCAHVQPKMAQSSHKPPVQPMAHRRPSPANKHPCKNSEKPKYKPHRGFKPWSLDLKYYKNNTYG